MQKDDCFELGHFSRLHGIKGELVAALETDRPEAYQNLESVFVDIRGELVPFFIESQAQNSRGQFILKLEEVGQEEATDLVGRYLFLPLSLLPPLQGKSFYFHEVIGFAMYDSEAGLLGECSKILDRSAQPIFVITGSQGQEILVPAVDEFIQKIDRSQQRIDLVLPPGLLELYG